LTLCTTSGLEFTTTADGLNFTQHLSAPASVTVIAATKRAQSMLERVGAARDECAAVAGNSVHQDRRGIKRATDER
jgi:oligoribonuclease (3'-5' exoribonuclease)